MRRLLDQDLNEECQSGSKRKKKTELNLVDDLKTEQKKIKYRDFLRRTFF